MSDSVGSVSVDVVPNASGWAEKLRAQLRDTTVKVPVKPEVDPKSEEDIGLKGKRSGEKFSGEFDRTVQTRIRAALDSLPDLKIQADTTDAQLKLDFIREELKALSDQKIGVDVSADDALAKIAAVRASLTDLAKQNPTDVQVNVDALAAETKLAEIQAQVDHLNGDTAKVGVKTEKSGFGRAASGLDSFLGKLGLIPTLAITAGAALIPLTAVVGGLAAAFAAPLAFVGGGLTLFGLLSGLAVKQTEEQQKKITALDQKLSGLTKGTKTYNQTQRELIALQKQMTPGQQKLLDAQNKLKGAFHDFLGGPAGAAMLGVITQGMMLLVKLLPLATPIILAVSGALSKLLTQFAHYASSPGFALLIHQIAHQIGPDLMIFGHIAGSVASALGPLLVMLGRNLSGDLMKQLEGLAHTFSDWAHSKSARQDVHDFIDYFHRVGPTVATTLGHLARLFERIVQALAPLGPPTLRVVSGIANVLSKIPVPVLTGLAAAFAGLVTVQKLGGLKLLGAIAGSTTGGGGVKGVVGSVLSGGIQKVYVVNMGEGGLGGGALGKDGKLLAGGSALEITAGVASIAVLGALTYHYEHKPLTDSIRNGLQDTANHTPGLGDPALGGDPRGRGGPHLPTMTPQHQGGAGEYVFNPNTKTYDWVAYSNKVGTAIDAIKAHAAQASRQIDLIGPHAQQAFGQASHDVDTFAAKLAALKDKKLAVILQDQAAISSLEHLQQMRLTDKHLTIYEKYQISEQGKGPGGGMGGHHAIGGLITGPGTGTSDSIPSMLSNHEFVMRAAAVSRYGLGLMQALNNGTLQANATRGYSPAQGAAAPVNIQVRGSVDEGGYITATAQDVYSTNRALEGAHG